MKNLVTEEKIMSCLDLELLRAKRILRIVFKNDIEKYREIIKAIDDALREASEDEDVWKYNLVRW